METSLKLSDEYELWFLINQARDVILQARERELEKYGITTMQAAVLVAVKLIGRPATATEIGRFLFRAPHTVSKIVDRMIAAGLVTRNTIRRGQKLIELTERGEEAFDYAMKTESINGIMSCMDCEAKDCLRKMLTHLRNYGLAYNSPLNIPFP